MDSYIIAFSGASNSGKTTAMEFISDILKNDYSKKTEFLKEPIREFTDEMTADGMRITQFKELYPNRYMEIQKITAEKRTQQEEQARSKYGYIHLADRAITDNYYYLDKYVNPEKLDQEHKIMFQETKSLLEEKMLRMASGRRYDMIIQFFPFNTGTDDRMRHENTMSEYTPILKLNEKYWMPPHTFKESESFTEYTIIYSSDKRTFVKINKNKNKIPLSEGRSFWKEFIERHLTDVIYNQ